jgi:hypothetical protein
MQRFRDCGASRCTLPTTTSFHPNVASSFRPRELPGVVDLLSIQYPSGANALLEGNHVEQEKKRDGYSRVNQPTAQRIERPAEQPSTGQGAMKAAPCVSLYISFQVNGR